MYEAWVVYNKLEGYVLTANCTCMAGLGSCCSHAAAILFKVKVIVRMGRTEKAAVTSGECVWKDLSKKEVQPAPLREIRFNKTKKPGRQLPDRCTSAAVRNTTTTVRELTDDDINELRIMAPGAAVLTSMDNSDTDTASSDSGTEEDEDLPEPLTSLFNISFRDLSPEEMEVKCEETFLRLKSRLLPRHCERVEFVSRQQSESSEWLSYRAGRIRSTRFHRCVTTDENISKAYLMDIMQYNKTQLNVPSVLWGKSMEEMARQTYTAVMAQSHEGFSVSSCGLVIRPSDPYLGSSPDGITQCTCCGKGVLEIKCPYKYCDGLQGSTEDTQFCLDKSHILKNSHPTGDCSKTTREAQPPLKMTNIV
ncbi:uncharacterized protein LOC132901441 isoform X2 [Neoarius graeffei]|nr:uncharacterized protein LOC132901441 isoform X2 [Neoarius graeffei]